MSESLDRFDPRPPAGLPPKGELLVRAFERFETACASLASRHDRLAEKVADLERRLARANRSLEAVLDSLEEAVAVLGPDGRILRANRAFVRMKLGAVGGFLEDSVLKELVGGSTGGRATARLRRETAGGAMDLVATVVPVAGEEPAKVLSLQDVSSIRREEEEGGRRRRLEALGRMAAELAHELRNPLGSIRLFAAMLRDDLSDRPASREMAEQIMAASAGLETTVANLLSFASPPRSAPRRLDLAAVARQTCSLFGGLCASRGVDLEGPSETASLPVVADPEGIRQVLLNLLGNALAATSSGGRILVAAVAREGGAVLSVEDTGCGIAPEDLPRVFDPFFSRSPGGTGLGLAIAHAIVERHRGRIWLESVPGKGTKAVVELPLPEGGEGGSDA
jgi:signal transduction histidine kinase